MSLADPDTRVTELVKDKTAQRETAYYGQRFPGEFALIHYVGHQINGSGNREKRTGGCNERNSPVQVHFLYFIDPERYRLVAVHYFVRHQHHKRAVGNFIQLFPETLSPRPKLDFVTFKKSVTPETTHRVVNVERKVF